MNLTLKDFLRDTLSGAREDPSVATTAIVIPVGKRTTLSLARKQIDASFDRIEKLLLPRKQAKPEHYSALDAMKRRGRKRAAAADQAMGHEGSAGGLLALLGGAVGVALSLMRSSSDYASQAMSAGVAAVTATKRAASGLVQAAVTDAMATVATVKRGVSGTWSSVSSAVMDTVGSTMDSSEEYAGRAGEYVEKTAVDAWGRVSHVVEEIGSGGIRDALRSAKDLIVAPSADLPQRMMTYVSDAIRKFGSNLYATLREWLWGAWRGGDVADEVGAGSSGGEGSSSTPEGGVAGGLGSATAEGNNPTGGYKAGDVGGLKSIGSTRSGKALSAHQQEAYEAARSMGVSDNAARALVANFSGESLTNPADSSADSGTAQGIASWHRDRSSRIAGKFGKEPSQMTVPEQMRAALWEMRTQKAYARTWAAIHSDASPEAILDTIVRNYEGPRYPDSDVQKRTGIMHGFTPAKPLDAYKLEEAPAAKPAEPASTPATSTPAPDSTPTPASTSPPPPAAAPSERAAAASNSSSEEQYPDHGRHKYGKPHVIRHVGGMLVVTHMGHA